MSDVQGQINGGPPGPVRVILREQVKDVLLARVAAGATVLMTTHILEVAERMAERIGVIVAGRLIAEGTLDELRRRAGRRDTTLEDIFLTLVASPAEAA